MREKQLASGQNKLTAQALHKEVCKSCLQYSMKITMKASIACVILSRAAACMAAPGALDFQY